MTVTLTNLVQMKTEDKLSMVRLAEHKAFVTGDVLWAYAVAIVPQLEPHSRPNFRA